MKNCNVGVVKIKNTHCYNTPYVNNNRKRTTAAPLNAEVTYVSYVNKHCFTRYGWCSC